MRGVGLLLVLCLAALPAMGKTYKWVDERGVTHYGDTIPPKYAGQGTEELNRRGLVIKRTERALTEDERRARDAALEKKREEDARRLEAERRDRALLNTYTSEEEIDLARNRNLQQIDLVIKGTALRLKSVDDRLSKSRGQAAALRGQNRPVPEWLREEIQDAEAERGRLKSIHDQKVSEMGDVRARYDAEKRRFNELKLQQPR